LEYIFIVKESDVRKGRKDVTENVGINNIKIKLKRKL